MSHLRSARWSTILVRAIVASLLSVLALTTPAGADDRTAPADGSVMAVGMYDTVCRGARSDKIVTIYWRLSSGENAVLRCGTATWGYWHINGRSFDGFTLETDRAIENTVKFGNPNRIGTKIEWRRAGFVVPVETRPFSDGAMMGIITAFHG